MENNRYLLKLRVGNLAQSLQKVKAPPENLVAKNITAKRECPCGFHEFSQEHLLMDCPYTEQWREAI
jgi:hypothetical protein